MDAETREAERGARTRDGREGDRERVGSGGEWVFSAPHLRCKMKGAGGVLSRGGGAARRRGLWQRSPESLVERTGEVLPKGP